MEIKKHKPVMRDMVKKFSYNKKGLSSIVMSVIMIALVIALMATVINFTKKDVNSKIKKSNSCGINLLDKLALNDNYVCYNSTNKRMIFSIERKDIDLDKLLIALEYDTSILKYELTENNVNNQNITNFNGSAGVSLPDKNAGKTYIIKNIENKPNKIEIAPIINDEQCDFVDSVNNIVDCSSTTILD